MIISKIFELDPNATDALEKCGHTIDPNYDKHNSLIGLSNKIFKFTDPEPIKVETEHDTVVRILKGDFEKKFGMTYDRFVELYNDILKNNPEKLI